MPMHDWTKVEAGIFHAFHHEWISEISRTLNRELLPLDYYALPEQVAAGFGPDVLTLQGGGDNDQQDLDDATRIAGEARSTLLQTRPQTRFVAESEAASYLRRKKSIVVRHSSGDRVVAIIEIVSPGNKSNRHSFQAFVDKACEFLQRRIHLLVIDPFPPGPRDPRGVHAAVWENFDGSSYEPPAEQPLTLVAYECDLITRAFIEPCAIGEPLPTMPLFLEPNGHIKIPLEPTYSAAFDNMPQRWRSVLTASR